MFAEIDSLLEGGVITSGLTSTLYTVLSRIPGITVVDGAKNYSGVPETGFQLSTEFGHTDQVTSMIIVNLDNGAYLGDRERSHGVDYASAVTTGVADRLGLAGS